MAKCMLNEDIWHHVLNFVPTEDLERINSCHPVLYEAWMRSRYATLEIVKRDKEMKRLLAHLCDPNVATHVKKVEIRPWLVQPRTKSHRSRTENLIVQFLELLDPYYTKKKAEQRLQKRLGKDVTRINAAFKQMKNVTEYTIYWDDSLGYHPELYSAFLTPTLETWSSHLVKLTVKVPPTMLNSLARIRLPKLEEFVFYFCTGSLSFKEINGAHDGFVVFLNNLKDSLTSLAFLSTHTSQDLDLSRIFRKMGFFPSLKKITLSIPFDGGHLSDPMTFVRFLERHRATLKDIDLFSSRCTPRIKPGDPDFINWIQRIIGAVHVPFPQLRSVGMSLRPLRAPLDSFIRFVDMHSSMLDSLKLTDRALSHSEVLTVLRSPSVTGFPPLDVTELQIKVDTLSAHLIVDLASLLPHLKILKIDCGKISTERGISEFSHVLNDNQGVITEWKLQRLAIHISEHNLAMRIGRDLRVYLPELSVSISLPS
ncbi:hypothetical protein CVT25_011027 [Psilocybe cyanescens]|uniref:F-box domain-containing protein n=1 Tax=Psilocybe cyanescens TaxID=93625 RepID=A0A409XWK8_PSICY|nr:hypothetical protein CVT25_011027 [Psilocybe cyanescens]